MLSCAASPISTDFEVLLGPVFFTWLTQLMLPVMLLSLVSEKQDGCEHSDSTGLHCLAPLSLLLYTHRLSETHASHPTVVHAKVAHLV